MDNLADKSENFYHIMGTMIDYHRDPTGALQNRRICGTYTDLNSAKAAASHALLDQGYEEAWFTNFDVKTRQQDWAHGDGTIVYARAPAGEVFTVTIQTAPNSFAFAGDAENKVTGELYHVLQTTIHYDKDRSGAVQDAEILGSFETYPAAKQMALTCLLDEDVTKESFAEYDENVGQDDWPFDSDVMVHAVGETGENVVIAVVEQA